MSKRRMFKIKQPTWARGISWEWGKIAVLPFDVLRMNLSPAEIQQAERMGMIEEILDEPRPEPVIQTMVAPAIVPPIQTPRKKKRGRPPKNESE